MKLDEQAAEQLTTVKYGKYYAIWGLTFLNKLNLKVFDLMKINGWELISVNWGDAVFRRKI